MGIIMVTTKIIASQCSLKITPSGEVTAITWKGSCLVTHAFLAKITRFDVEEYTKYNSELPEEIDILNIGYWIGDDYCPPIRAGKVRNSDVTNDAGVSTVSSSTRKEN